MNLKMSSSLTLAKYYFHSLAVQDIIPSTQYPPFWTALASLIPSSRIFLLFFFYYMTTYALSIPTSILSFEFCLCLSIPWSCVLKRSYFCSKSSANSKLWLSYFQSLNTNVCTIIVVKQLNILTVSLTLCGIAATVETNRTSEWAQTHHRCS